MLYDLLSQYFTFRIDKTYDSSWLRHSVCGGIIDPRIDQRLLRNCGDAPDTLLIRKLLRRLCSAVLFKRHMQEMALESLFVDHHILSSVCKSLL